MGLLERLQFVIENDFERIAYREAIDILRNSKPNKKKKFKYIIEGFGSDLQSEHERYLVEKKFKKPIPSNIDFYPGDYIIDIANKIFNYKAQTPTCFFLLQNKETATKNIGYERFRLIGFQIKKLKD